MDPLDSRNSIEIVLEKERKMMDILRVASVTVKGKDPIFATSVVWLFGNGHIPEFRDHVYHEGELVLPDLRMGDFY